MKNPVSKLTLLAAALLAALAAPVAGQSAGGGDPVPILYAAGFVDNENSPYTAATVWKLTNGAVQTIPLTDGKMPAVVTALIESSSSLYAAGFKTNESGPYTTYTTATVWKLTNDAVQTIFLSKSKERQYAGVYALVASGSSLYAAGFERNDYGKDVATVWQITDSAVHTIPLTDGKQHAEVRALLESVDGLYAAGCERGAGNTSIATVWKLAEGKVETIPLTGGGSFAVAEALIESACGFYAAGYDFEWSKSGNGIAKVWKLADGTVQTIPLTGGTRGAAARALVESGGSLYAAGDEYNAEGSRRTATIWKLTDGKVQTIPLSGGTGGHAYANTLIECARHLYTSGFEQNKSGTAIATVWKLTDGKVQTIPLSGGNSFALIKGSADTQTRLQEED